MVLDTRQVRPAAAATFTEAHTPIVAQAPSALPPQAGSASPRR